MDSNRIMNLFCHSSYFKDELMTLNDFVCRHAIDKICYCLDSCVVIEIEKYVTEKHASLSEEDLALLNHLQYCPNSLVEAAIAIEELSSPRGKYDELLPIWYREIMACFYDLKRPRVQRPELEIADYPSSFAPLLSNDFPLRNMLIVSYSCALKALSLLKDVEMQKLNRKQASISFLDFVVEEVGLSPIPMCLLFIKILWGDNKLQTMIYPTKCRGLYKVYNGSMDMILPVAYRTFVRRKHPDYHYAFITADQELAKIDASIVEHPIFEMEGSLYEPRVVSYDLNSGVKDEDAKEAIWKKLEELNALALRHGLGGDGKTMRHLLPIIPVLEREVQEKYSIQG